jgi:hypothetical protein
MQPQRVYNKTAGQGVVHPLLLGRFSICKGLPMGRKTMAQLQEHLVSLDGIR